MRDKAFASDSLYDPPTKLSVLLRTIVKNTADEEAVNEAEEAFITNMNQQQPYNPQTDTWDVAQARDPQLSNRRFDGVEEERQDLWRREERRYSRSSSAQQVTQASQLPQQSLRADSQAWHGQTQPSYQAGSEQQPSYANGGGLNPAYTPQPIDHSFGGGRAWQDNTQTPKPHQPYRPPPAQSLSSKDQASEQDIAHQAAPSYALPPHHQHYNSTAYQQPLHLPQQVYQPAPGAPQHSGSYAPPPAASVPVSTPSYAQVSQAANAFAAPAQASKAPVSYMPYQPYQPQTQQPPPAAQTPSEQEPYLQPACSSQPYSTAVTAPIAGYSPTSGGYALQTANSAPAARYTPASQNYVPMSSDHAAPTPAYPQVTAAHTLPTSAYVPSSLAMPAHQQPSFPALCSTPTAPAASYQPPSQEPAGYVPHYPPPAGYAPPYRPAGGYAPPYQQPAMMPGYAQQYQPMGGYYPPYPPAPAHYSPYQLPPSAQGISAQGVAQGIPVNQMAPCAPSYIQSWQQPAAYVPQPAPQGINQQVIDKASEQNVTGSLQQPDAGAHLAPILTSQKVETSQRAPTPVALDEPGSYRRWETDRVAKAEATQLRKPESAPQQYVPGRQGNDIHGWGSTESPVHSGAKPTSTDTHEAFSRDAPVRSEMLKSGGRSVCHTPEGSDYINEVHVLKSQPGYGSKSESGYRSNAQAPPSHGTSLKQQAQAPQYGPPQDGWGSPPDAGKKDKETSGWGTISPTKDDSGWGAFPVKPARQEPSKPITSYHDKDTAGFPEERFEPKDGLGGESVEASGWGERQGSGAQQADTWGQPHSQTAEDNGYKSGGDFGGGAYSEGSFGEPLADRNAIKERAAKMAALLGKMPTRLQLVENAKKSGVEPPPLASQSTEAPRPAYTFNSFGHREDSYSRGSRDEETYGRSNTGEAYYGTRDRERPESDQFGDYGRGIAHGDDQQASRGGGRNWSNAPSGEQETRAGGPENLDVKQDERPPTNPHPIDEGIVGWGEAPAAAIADDGWGASLAPQSSPSKFASPVKLDPKPEAPRAAADGWGALPSPAKGAGGWSPDTNAKPAKDNLPCEPRTTSPRDEPNKDGGLSKEISGWGAVPSAAAATDDPFGEDAVAPASGNSNSAGAGESNGEQAYEFGSYASNEPPPLTDRNSILERAKKARAMLGVVPTCTELREKAEKDEAERAAKKEAKIAAALAAGLPPPKETRYAPAVLEDNIHGWGEANNAAMAKVDSGWGNLQDRPSVLPVPQQDSGQIHPEERAVPAEKHETKPEASREPEPMGWGELPSASGHIDDGWGASPVKELKEPQKFERPASWGPPPGEVHAEQRPASRGPHPNDEKTASQNGSCANPTTAQAPVQSSGLVSAPSETQHQEQPCQIRKDQAACTVPKPDTPKGSGWSPSPEKGEGGRGDSPVELSRDKHVVELSANPHAGSSWEPSPLKVASGTSEIPTDQPENTRYEELPATPEASRGVRASPVKAEGGGAWSPDGPVQEGPAVQAASGWVSSPTRTDGEGLGACAVPAADKKGMPKLAMDQTNTKDREGYSSHYQHDDRDPSRFEGGEGSTPRASAARGLIPAQAKLGIMNYLKKDSQLVSHRGSSASLVPALYNDECAPSPVIAAGVNSNEQTNMPASEPQGFRDTLEAMAASNTPQNTPLPTPAKLPTPGTDVQLSLVTCNDPVAPVMAVLGVKDVDSNGVSAQALQSSLEPLADAPSEGSKGAEPETSAVSVVLATVPGEIESAAEDVCVSIKIMADAIVPIAEISSQSPDPPGKTLMSSAIPSAEIPPQQVSPLAAEPGAEAPDSAAAVPDIPETLTAPGLLVAHALMKESPHPVEESPAPNLPKPPTDLLAAAPEEGAPDKQTPVAPTAVGAFTPPPVLSKAQDAEAASVASASSTQAQPPTSPKAPPSLPEESFEVDHDGSSLVSEGASTSVGGDTASKDEESSSIAAKEEKAHSETAGSEPADTAAFPALAAAEEQKKTVHDSEPASTSQASLTNSKDANRVDAPAAQIPPVPTTADNIVSEAIVPTAGAASVQPDAPAVAAEAADNESAAAEESTR